jgi:hypothetical protein
MKRSSNPERIKNGKFNSIRLEQLHLKKEFALEIFALAARMNV